MTSKIKIPFPVLLIFSLLAPQSSGAFSYPLLSSAGRIIPGTWSAGGAALAAMIEQAGEIQAPEKAKKNEWLIAVYMNGKSNIEPFALNDFNRLESVGSSEKVKIVAEIGRSEGFDNDIHADGNWTGVRRYLVKKDPDPEKINSPLLADLGEADMGDWREAAGFLSWAKINYPAEKVMFLIWDHGWGWIDPITPSSSLLDGGKSISHDFAANNYIKTTELKNIFEKSGPVDLYASMACFMQMGEVAYEIKDYAGVIVGSEEVIQLPSFNFEDFLGLMTENPGVDAERAGTYLVDTFREMYSRPEYLDMLEETGYGTQLSAIRGSKLEKFAELAGDLAKSAMLLDDAAAVSKAKKEVLRFEVGDETTDPLKLISFYADPYDFSELLEKHLSFPGSPLARRYARAAKKFRDFIDRELVVKNVFLSKDRTGKDYSRTHGISLHIPGAEGHLIYYADTYGKLEFAGASSWAGFIEYLENVR